MTGLKKGNRIVISVLAVLLLCLVVFFIDCYIGGKKKAMLLLAVPSRILVLEGVADGLYRIKGTQYPVVGVKDSDQELLDPTNSTDEVIFNDSQVIKIICDSMLRVEFIPEYDLMAKQMAPYTDNLATHDNNLYRLVVAPISVFNISSVVSKSKKGILGSISLLLDIMRYNIETRVSYHYSTIITNVDFLEGTNSLSNYEYVYKDLVSNRTYLLESLPGEEKKWGIRYYPAALLADSLIEPDTILPVISNTDGSLCKILNSSALIQKEFYSYLPDMNLFLKCICNRSCDNSNLPIETYLQDTERMNLLVKQFYSEAHM